MPKEYTLIGGNGTRVSPLEVTESGTYEAGDSRAFNPVKVNVPSGSTTLAGLTDVDISNPSDGQMLVYNATSGKWENGAASGGVLIITGTLDSVEQEVVLNKTYNEIKNAYLAGLTCIVNTEEDHGDVDYVEIGNVYAIVVDITEIESGDPGLTSMTYIVDAGSGRYAANSPSDFPRTMK